MSGTSAQLGLRDLHAAGQSAQLLFHRFVDLARRLVDGRHHQVAVDAGLHLAVECVLEDGDVTVGGRPRQQVAVLGEDARDRLPEALELASVVDMLMNSADLAADATLPHDAAWAAVKRDVKRIRGYSESDLDDTSELTYATHCKALEILFRLYGMDEDREEYWRHKYLNELRGVFLTVSGSETASNGRTTLLVRG